MSALAFPDAVGHAAARQGSAPPADIAQRALLDRYCVTCHNSRAKSGGLVLEQIDLTNVGAQGEVWEKVVRKVRAGMMPPPGVPAPAEADRQALLASLESSLDQAALASPQPGRPLVHRLNRAEYANAIRDLVYAIINAHFDLAAMLAERGADPNLADQTGMAALYAAIEWNTLQWVQSRPSPIWRDRLTGTDLVRLLLARGDGPRIRVPTEAGAVEVVTLLLDRGAMMIEAGGRGGVRRESTAALLRNAAGQT